MAVYSQGRQKNAYITGAAARNIDVKRALEERPDFHTLKDYESEAKKESKMCMSFLYIMFLTVALVVMGYVLVSYLKLQSEITKMVDDIAFYETTLNNLTLANDDEYSKMETAVDYDEIRKIAIEELGMVYASENQIITYTRENSDYVRQLNDLSD